MKKSVVVGAAGWGNVGDDIIALRLIERLKEEGAQSMVLLGGPLPIDGMGNGVQRVAMIGGARNRVRVVFALLRADRIVIGGGGLFDDRSPHFYRPFIRCADVAHKLGIPYAIVGVGVGPIRQTESASDYRRVFENAETASVRDMESSDRIAATGASAPTLCDDPALWPSSQRMLSTPRLDVLVNLRSWPRASDDTVAFTDGHIEDLAAALNRAPEMSIGLVSMSVLEGDDDSVPLRKLAAMLSHSRIEEYYKGSPILVDSLVANSRSVITMRLHLALLGVRHGLRISAIAYDRKLQQQGSKYGFNAHPLNEHFKPANVVSEILGPSAFGADGQQ